MEGETLKIKRYIGGSLESNGYIISNKEKGSCYIIDPGYEPKKFIDMHYHRDFELLYIEGRCYFEVFGRTIYQRYLLILLR